MSEFKDLEQLLRLKRYEKPPEDYYEQFFSEFQARQRSEMLRQSAHGLFFERVTTWMWGLGNRRWLYAGGAAYAAVMIVVFLRPMSEMFAPSIDEAAVIHKAEVPDPGETKSDEAADSDSAYDSSLPEGVKALGSVREF